MLPFPFKLEFAKILSRGEFIFGRRGRRALMLAIPFKLEFAKILYRGRGALAQIASCRA